MTNSDLRSFLNSAAGIASVVLAAATLAAAQSPATSEPAGDVRFRADTHEVLVDTIVVDKKGGFPSDLTQQDFRVWEDGKEQKITSFSLESAQIQGHAAKRYIALVFDADKPGFREEAIRFVDRFSDPALNIAVFARVNAEIKLKQEFTTDGARIKAALNSMQVIGDPALFSYARPSRNLVLERVSTVAAALAPIPGRKALALFSIDYYSQRAVNGGALIVGTNVIASKAPPAIVAHMSETIDDCIKANVSVYSFHVGAVNGESGNFNDPPPPPEDPGAFTNLMRDLAEGTGGTYTSPRLNDLSSFLGSLAKERNDRYLLGYTPSAGSVNQTCHKVKVKVDRKGLAVRARDSYCVSAR